MIKRVSSDNQNSPSAPSKNNAQALTELATRAGILVDWTDNRGQPQRVNHDVLRTVLKALELPAESASQVQESMAQLAEEEATPTSFIVGNIDTSIEIPHTPEKQFEVINEAGESMVLHAQHHHDSSTWLPPSSTWPVPFTQPGYYKVRAHSQEWTLAIAPPRCPSMGELLKTTNPRAWGIAAQLYSLRQTQGIKEDIAGGDTAATYHPSRVGQESQHATAIHDSPLTHEDTHPNYQYAVTHASGMGDFTALAQLATAAATHGASAVAISPVHALFAANPYHYSPYAPSSRLFLNSLYVDPALLLGKAAVATALNALHLNQEVLRLDRLALIDWPHIARLRLTLMRKLYEDFSKSPAPPLAADLQNFRCTAGKALEQHACFEALYTHYFSQSSPVSHWRLWAADQRHPNSAGVHAYAQAHAHEVSFHVFLQWLAARGLQHAQQTARSAGMKIGLIGDLAVGTDPAGSHAWSRQEDILNGLSPGAPPDIYNPLGQCWGLTAFSPRSLRRRRYAAFIEMLRATLAYTGGIRIDHILGLRRLWLVPDGAHPKQGAYLRYPLENMLRLIALEAWRHQAVVIGENLGTVPEGLNDQLEQAGVLGINLLWFQREGGQETPSFQAPTRWPSTSIATTTTHDLPTVAGWWQGHDITWRTQLRLLGERETEAGLRQQHAKDRTALWQALEQAGCATTHTDTETPREDTTTQPPPDSPSKTSVSKEATLSTENPSLKLPVEPPIQEVLQFIATTPAPLVLVPVEDLLGLVEQPNLPGTLDTHPNWRRRLNVSADQLFDNSLVKLRLAALTRYRNTNESPLKSED